MGKLIRIDENATHLIKYQGKIVGYISDGVSAYQDEAVSTTEQAMKIDLIAQHIEIPNE